MSRGIAADDVHYPDRTASVGEITTYTRRLFPYHPVLPPNILSHLLGAQKWRARDDAAALQLPTR